MIPQLISLYWGPAHNHQLANPNPRNDCTVYTRSFHTINTSISFIQASQTPHPIPSNSLSLNHTALPIPILPYQTSNNNRVNDLTSSTPLYSKQIFQTARKRGKKKRKRKKKKEKEGEGSKKNIIHIQLAIHIIPYDIRYDTPPLTCSGEKETSSHRRGGSLLL